MLKGELPISSGPVAGEEPVARPVARPVAQPTTPATPVEGILPPSERRAAMNGLDRNERKWAFGGLVAETLFAAVLTSYLAIAHPNNTAIVHHKKTLVPISDSYILYGALILVISIAGLIALQRNKRTLVSYALILSGFVLTLFYPPVGFLFIVLGGWILWRAYRIQKYGTANAKQAARQAATRPPRQSRKAAAAAAAAKPTGYKAPTANKRYTPKAPPRKKVPKPTE
jgi:hypothetical protein